MLCKYLFLIDTFKPMCAGMFVFPVLIVITT